MRLWCDRYVYTVGELIAELRALLDEGKARPDSVIQGASMPSYVDSQSVRVHDLLSKAYPIVEGVKEVCVILEL